MGDTSAQTSVLAMSDEEALNIDPTIFEAAETEEEAEDEDASEAVESADEEEEGTSESDEETSEVVDALEEEAESGEESEDSASDDEDESTDVEDGDQDEAVDNAAAEKDKASTEAERIFAPFKANGKEMKVGNVDEAIQLMQMGANYNKKMAGLKPNLRMMKMLDKNNLLSEEKLNYLIDLNNGDPKAIGKLLKDSKLEPMDIDASDGSQYTPSNHGVDESEMALDEVIEGIKDSEHYNQTIDLVTAQWDEASRNVVAGAPKLLSVINGHMASGVYTLIKQQVEREKMLGKHVGVSDIEAYRAVGDSLNAEGKFDHLANPESKEAEGHQDKPVAKALSQKKREKAESTRKRKRAASSSKASPTQAQPTGFNPLAMSDAEYEKQFNSDFI